jgi:hypothetical protein
MEFGHNQMIQALNNMDNFVDMSDMDMEMEMDQQKRRYLTQWMTDGGNAFLPASTSQPTLPAGLYEIRRSQSGMYFEGISAISEGLVRFPETEVDMVTEEIRTFWQKEEMYRKYDISYRRGILLYGPPGSGKTCTIKMAMAEIIAQGGIVVKFTDPESFVIGTRNFREIEPSRPFIVLMEDIDTLAEMFGESIIGNILDGIEGIDKVVFLATTNYPERLGDRIINRPSRFDKRFKIGMPSPASREIYLEHLIAIGEADPEATPLAKKAKKSPKKSRLRNPGFDMAKWVRDTEGMSLAHVKELFVSVTIMEYEYDRALAQLVAMKDLISSSTFLPQNELGFNQ